MLSKMEGRDTKYLYLIQWWQPFPASEYGGILVVIASNDAECKRLLETRFPEQTKQYVGAFTAALLDATRLELSEDESAARVSEIVNEFIT